MHHCPHRCTGNFTESGLRSHLRAIHHEAPPAVTTSKLASRSMASLVRQALHLTTQLEHIASEIDRRRRG